MSGNWKHKKDGVSDTTGNTEKACNQSKSSLREKGSPTNNEALKREKSKGDVENDDIYANGRQKEKRGIQKDPEMGEKTICELKSGLEDEQLQLKEQENEKKDLQKELAKRDKRISELETLFEDGQMKLKDAEAKLSKFEIQEHEKRNLQTELEKSERKICELNNQLDDKHMRWKETEAKLIHKIDTKKTIKKKLSEAQKENDNLNSDLRKAENSIEGLREDKRKLEQELCAMKATYKELSMKYGRVALAMQKKDNSAVDDLSDPNRAIKLKEMYDELYTKTWTQVFRAVKKQHVKERDIVHHLLDILKRSWDFCRTTKDRNQDLITCYLLHPCQTESPDKQIRGQSRTLMSDDQRDDLQHVIKRISAGAVGEVFQAFLETERKSTTAQASQGNEHFRLYQPFYKSCIEFCWPAVLNWPPITMLTNINRGDSINENLYTMRSSGDRVDSLVWPPLLMGKEGHVLNKGVVEGMKSFQRN